MNERVKMNLLKMNINLKGRYTHLFYKYVLSICQILLCVLEIRQGAKQDELIAVCGGTRKKHLNECSLDF